MSKAAVERSGVSQVGRERHRREELLETLTEHDLRRNGALEKRRVPEHPGEVRPGSMHSEEGVERLVDGKH